MSKKPKIKPKLHKNDMFLDITSNKKVLMSKMPKHSKDQNILNAKTF